jgi:gas vesicle protein
MNTTKKVLVGALSGLAVGVVFGILVAPASGKETRDRMAMQADKLRKKLNRLRNRAEDELEELEDVFNHEIAGLKDDVRQRVLNLIEAKRNKKVPEPSLS